MSPAPACKCGQPSTRGDSRGRYCETCWAQRQANRCKERVPDREGWGYTRCKRQRTKGDYCTQHAKMKGEAA